MMNLLNLIKLLPYLSQSQQAQPMQMGNLFNTSIVDPNAMPEKDLTQGLWNGYRKPRNVMS